MKRLLFAAISLAVFLGLVAYFYKNQAEEQERVKNVYKGNIEVLIRRIRKVYADKVETDRANEELRQAIREDKNSSFNWSEDISSTLPILSLKRMHKERSNLRWVRAWAYNLYR